MTEMPKEKALMFVWDFPAQDFPTWKKLCAEEDDFSTYSEYQAALAGIERLMNKSNQQVVRLKIPVSKFMILLAQRGLENTSANRARLLNQVGMEQQGIAKQGDKAAK
jgi:hypothetical protein